MFWSQKIHAPIVNEVSRELKRKSYVCTNSRSGEEGFSRCEARYNQAKRKKRSAAQTPAADSGKAQWHVQQDAYLLEKNINSVLRVYNHAGKAGMNSAYSVILETKTPT